MYSLIIYSPASSADAIRNAAAKAGAGKIGNYESCSFSSRGTGRYRPLKGATPAIGSIGTLEEVEEERIEFVVNDDVLQDVLQAIITVHPYEQPAIHVIKIEDYTKWIMDRG